MLAGPDPASPRGVGAGEEPLAHTGMSPEALAVFLAAALHVPEIGIRVETDFQRPGRVWLSLGDGSMFRLDATLVAHASTI